MASTMPPEASSSHGASCSGSREREARRATAPSAKTGLPNAVRRYAPAPREKPDRNKPQVPPLAREVGEFRWAAGAPRLTWLERYDPRVRSGTAGAGGLDAPARTFASHVSDIEISPDGRKVAFLQHSTRGGYSVDLGLAHLDPATTQTTVATGAFGFAFSPDARWLYYRTRCVRNAEACDLERIPAAGLAPGAAPERIADGVKSFEFDPRDPERSPEQAARLRERLLVPAPRAQERDVVRDAAVEGDDEADRELGHRHGVLPGAVRDVDAAPRRRRDVDGVHARAGPDHERQGGGALEHGRGDLLRADDEGGRVERGGRQLLRRHVRPVVHREPERAEAVESFEREGRVRAHGEIWSAVSREPIREGQRLRILAVKGLRLEVEPAKD